MFLAIPFNSPFMSLSFSRYVRLIFHVCPFLSLPVISLHLPSCPLVSLSFVCLAVPLTPPCFHFFPFMSFSVPLRFPFISLPCIFPSLPGIFSDKNTAFSNVFTKRMSKTQCFQIFGKRIQKTRTSKEPAGGFEPGTPVLQHWLSEDYF